MFKWFKELGGPKKDDERSGVELRDRSRAVDPFIRERLDEPESFDEEGEGRKEEIEHSETRSDYSESLKRLLGWGSPETEEEASSVDHSLLDDEENPIQDSTTQSSYSARFKRFIGWGSSRIEEGPGAEQRKRIAELEKSLVSAQENATKARAKAQKLKREKKPLAARRELALAKGYEEHVANLRNTLNQTRAESLASAHRSGPLPIARFEEPFEDFDEGESEESASTLSPYPASHRPPTSSSSRRQLIIDDESESDDDEDSDLEDSESNSPPRSSDTSYKEYSLRDNEGKIEFRKTTNKFLGTTRSEVIVRGTAVTTSPNKKSNLQQAVDIVASNKDFEDVLFIRGSVENIQENLRALHFKNPKYDGKIFVQSPRDPKAILLSSNNAEFRALFRQPSSEDDEFRGRSLHK